VRSGHRTALLDAIYYGVAKMKDARARTQGAAGGSDGGDNRSRYTEGEIRAQVRESDVEIYSIGIFDPYAPTPEERTGPQLLNDFERRRRVGACFASTIWPKWATLREEFPPNCATSM